LAAAVTVTVTVTVAGRLRGNLLVWWKLRWFTIRFTGWQGGSLDTHGKEGGGTVAAESGEAVMDVNELGDGVDEKQGLTITTSWASPPQP
jgi:hypothetical protein